MGWFDGLKSWIKRATKVPHKQDPRTYYVKKPLTHPVGDIPPCSLILMTHEVGKNWLLDALGWAIRWITKGPVCHAVLYMGSGKHEIIEAGPEGVIKCSIDKYINDRDMFIIFTMPSMTVEQMQRIKNKAYSMVGEPYDYKAIAGFVFGYKQDTPGQVICSETAVRAFMEMPYRFCPDKSPDQIDPNDLYQWDITHQEWVVFDTQNFILNA
jgi:uncharacterized protein YycO